jgi:hypothetical protein
VSLGYTVLLFAFGLFLVGIALWREKRPRKSLDPSLVANGPILFIGLLIIVLTGIHLTTFLR